MLRIERFENWPCAHRWKSYEIGQELFVFIRSNHGKLFSMSGGNEGEQPIQRDSVFVKGLGRPLPPKPPPGFYDHTIDSVRDEPAFISRAYHVYGSYYSGIAIEKTEFINAVKSIRDCFDFEYGEYNEIINGVIICDKKIVAIKMENDKIFQWAYKLLIE